MIDLDLFKGVSGIYKICNVLSGRFYIGSAYNIKTRFIKHKSNLKNKVHHSKKLQLDWDKFSENAFTLEVLEVVEKPNLISREQWYIDSLNPYYNVAKMAGSTVGHKHSDDTKKKMSQIKLNDENFKNHLKLLHEKNKHRFSKEKNPFYGKKHTEETKKIMSEKRRLITVRRGHKMSEETKKKISEAKKLKKRHHTQEFKDALSKRVKGVKFTDDHKLKIKLSLRAYFENKKQQKIKT